MVMAGSWLEVEATWSCCAWISARTCSRMRLKRPVSDYPGTGSGSVWGIGVVVETDLPVLMVWTNVEPVLASFGTRVLKT